LLEPVAWKAGTAGSEGAPAQQCAGATRRDLLRDHHPPSHPPRHLRLGPRSDEAITAFIDGWNERCQPFVWTKDADSIYRESAP
jgi:hypothetical protein